MKQWSDVASTVTRIECDYKDLENFISQHLVLEYPDIFTTFNLIRDQEWHNDANYTLYVGDEDITLARETLMENDGYGHYAGAALTILQHMGLIPANVYELTVKVNW